MQTTNKIKLTGQIEGDLTYDYTACAENFLKGRLKVVRLSEQIDSLPFVISERLVKDMEYCTIEGTLRSRNIYDNGKSKLIINAFAEKMTQAQEGDNNAVYLEGYICKAPIYRLTPLDREITDMLLAVNRAYGKSDYIPCITWGRNARYCSGLKVGTKIGVQGRFQSREYQKKTTEGVYAKIAYEMSVNKLIEF